MGWHTALTWTKLKASSWDVVTNALFDDWSNVSFYVKFENLCKNQSLEAGHPTPKLMVLHSSVSNVCKYLKLAGR